MATFWFYIISCILSKGLFGLLSPLCLHFIYINIMIYYPCLQFVSSVLTVNCGACSSHAVTAIWGQAPVAAGMVALTSLYPTTFPSSSLGPWWSPGFLKPHQIWQNQQNHIFSKEQRCDSEVTKPKLESSQLRHLLRLTPEERQLTSETSCLPPQRMWWLCPRVPSPESSDRFPELAVMTW